MTTVTGSGRGNLGVQEVFQPGTINITSFTDTTVVANNVTFTGTGFTYTSSVQNGVTIYQPTGGTITGISAFAHTWSGFSVPLVTAFNNILNATAFNNLFFSGNDTFNWTGVPIGIYYGLAAGDGDDTINVSNYGGTSSGSNRIDGGSGTDTVNLTGGLAGTFSDTDFQPVENFLAMNVETINLGAGANYTFVAFSNLVSSGNTLKIDGSALGAGNSFAFTTNTRNDPGTFAGNITLIGGAGDDIFQGGSGLNTFIGGSGSDTVSLNHGGRGGGVTANLSISGPQSVGDYWGGTDIFIGVENLVGTEFADTLTGNSANNVLTSNGGADTLNGGGGRDTAVFNGTFSSYTVIHNVDGSYTVGSSALTNIEKLTFSDRSVAIGSTPAADFNATGQSDLLWQNTNGQAAIWLMNGAVRTGAAEVGANPGSSWHIRGSGDFDGDGKADILWQNDSGLAALWLIDGTGIASTAEVGSNPGASWRVAGAGDFNGDGKSDIVWQNKDGRAAIWMMNGAAVGVNGLVAADNPGKAWRIVGSGDFNGDTKADILFQRANGDIAIWLMDGLGVTGSAVLSPGDPTLRVKAVGDFNGDFKADIVWQSDTGEASIWNMDGLAHTGGGTLAINPGTSWHIVGTGNYDTGNTKLDLLWQNDNGNVTSWYMDNTTRTGGDDLAAPGASWKIANNGVSQPSYRTSDFDGDGKADFLWYNIIDHRAAIWTLSNGAKTGGDELSPKVDASWRVIGSSDFNGDGKADVVWQNNDGTAAVWLMNGTTRIGGDTIGSTPGADWTLYDTGDFNGDGNTDLLWQNWRDGTVAVWTMNGLVRTGGQVVSDSPGPSWHVIGSGDFNGDGKSDILFQNQDGRAGVWLMNGFSLLQGAAVGDNPGTNWIVKGAGDFDGDGKSDILWQTSSNGQMAIWKMDGLGVVNTAVLNAPGFSMWTGIQDMNGDGKSDILFLDQTDRHASAALMNGITKIGQYDFAPISDKGWQIYADAG